MIAMSRATAPASLASANADAAWQYRRAEIDGTKYSLQLNADGLPYVLKRYQRANGFGRWHWGTVWAEWHVGLPTGQRREAVAQMGFQWRNDTAETHGWHQVDSAA